MEYDVTNKQQLGIDYFTFPLLLITFGGTMIFFAGMYDIKDKLFSRIKIWGRVTIQEVNRLMQVALCPNVQPSCLSIGATGTGAGSLEGGVGTNARRHDTPQKKFDDQDCVKGEWSRMQGE